MLDQDGNHKIDKEFIIYQETFNQFGLLNNLGYSALGYRLRPMKILKKIFFHSVIKHSITLIIVILSLY